MPMFINKNNTYLLQNSRSQISNSYVETILYLHQSNSKQQILGFQNTRLMYCHELMGKLIHDNT